MNRRNHSYFEFRRYWPRKGGSGDVEVRAAKRESALNRHIAYIPARCLRDVPRPLEYVSFRRFDCTSSSHLHAGQRIRTDRPVQKTQQRAKPTTTGSAVIRYPWARVSFLGIRDEPFANHDLCAQDAPSRVTRPVIYSASEPRTRITGELAYSPEYASVITIAGRT